MSMDRYYNLTEAVLFDILLYLPVMSLLRFKAVCKYWLTLIESSNFISKHLNHNRDSKEDDFIILGNINQEAKVALVHSSQYRECVHDIDIGQFWLPATIDDVTLTCCFEGIVLCQMLNTPGMEIALWNPALKQYRPIPPPLFSELVLQKDTSETPFSFSFGIDVKSNAYKLVGIMFEISRKLGCIGNQVEEYNLGGDNAWRIIHKNVILPFYNKYTFNPIFSRKSGKSFWTALRHDKTIQPSILVSFDFSDDVFRTMLLPVEARTHLHCDLDFLDDRVVYIVEGYADTWTDKFIDIWMLNEFGVEKSWNMIYKVGPFFYFDFIFYRQISKSGEFFICSKSDATEAVGASGRHMFYLYNLHNQQGKYIHNRGLEISATGAIFHYKASLISLKSANMVKANRLI